MCTVSMADNLKHDPVQPNPVARAIEPSLPKLRASTAKSVGMSCSANTGASSLARVCTSRNGSKCTFSITGSKDTKPTRDSPRAASAVSTFAVVLANTGRST